jgi:hypothetical protein
LDAVVGIDFTKREVVFDQSFKDQLLTHLGGANAQRSRDRKAGERGLRRAMRSRASTYRRSTLSIKRPCSC